MSATYERYRKKIADYCDSKGVKIYANHWYICKLANIYIQTYI